MKERVYYKTEEDSIIRASFREGDTSRKSIQAKLKEAGYVRTEGSINARIDRLCHTDRLYN